MVHVADNTGAKIIQCFRVLGGSSKKYGQIGDIIVATVKEVDPRRLVKTHDKVKAVIVRQRRPYRRLDGSYIRFDDNAAVILETGKEPKGGRVFGPIPREIKDKGFSTIAGLAPEIL